MRGRDHARAAIGERLEAGLRDGGALARVGARADLVEQHQRARAGFVDDAREVGHVRGERREALADVLLVADVGEHRVEPIDPRAGLGRHEQARAHAERRERDGLERDRLAPGVRPGEHEHVVALAEARVVRDGLVGGEQRVAQPERADDALRRRPRGVSRASPARASARAKARSMP